jgi:ABC-2 type transport system permease protein
MFTWNLSEESDKGMGLKKTLSDITIIARIYYLQFRDQLGKYLFCGFLIPLASFLLASATAGSERPQLLRFFTGAVLLSFSMLTIMWLGSILIEDRFYGRLKLFITAPLSPASYVLGVLLYANVLGLVTSLGLFLGAQILSLPVRPQIVELFLVVFLTLTTFASIGVVLSQYAGSLQAGGVLGDSLSIIMIFLSPVYYSMEILPPGMQVLAAFLPPTYTADGISKGLTATSGVGKDILVLLVMSVITLTLAVRSVRWREG